MKRKLKVNDFFCGCGGMGIAFKNAGYEIAGAWDFDKYAVESYRANVGDHVQKADIKELHQADIPQADVWAFGFPCQDLSVAGKQRGMILKCEDCGEEIEINPEEYTGNTICPKCSSNNFKAASRSGCFFEMMRLLEETEREREHAMPAVIIAENVRGLRPYLPVLRLEYERHGYTAHIEMFNSKYWNVPQGRDRYAVVGTRNKKNLSFTFPKEQHEFVPKLSDYLEKDVPEKYYLPDEKAQTIIAQAMEKLEKMGKCHACITPDRINKRQNGPRAKAEDEPMFTLTAQDLHGVIILEDEQTEESVVMDIAEETGLLDPNGCGKTLRVGGGGSITKKHNYQEMQKLTDADYDGVIEDSITRAIRRYASRQILVGDGTSGKFKGIFYNPASESDDIIDRNTDITTITAVADDTLDEIIYSYGGDEEVEDVAVLILSKKDLKKFAKLRDKQGRKVYTIVNHGNTGTIDEVPYIINSACAEIGGTKDAYCMAYGPLSNYEVAVFSDIETAKSTDYKFKSGQICYKGCVFMGGNVVARNGFIRVKNPAA